MNAVSLLSKLINIIGKIEKKKEPMLPAIVLFGVILVSLLV